VRSQNRENDRLSITLTQTVQQLKEIQTQSGQLAAENEVLQLRLKELKALYPKLLDEIRNLKINPKRAESISTTAINTEKRIVTMLRDSMIHDTVALKVFSYTDNYYQVQGIAQDSTQEVKSKYQDTLVQVIYLGPREKPWLWIFSPRKLQQRVTLKNPNARITYSEFIQIQKRKSK
jgi:regulator of replication initiation timing